MRKSIILIFILALLLPITVNAENNYLYDVLKNEAESNGLAKEYTGEHHDSFTKEPSKKIYHWYADTNSKASQVLDKNNLIFANHCWQMIRTTDTGGVKLIYNGIPTEGKCNNTGENQQVGNSKYSKDNTYYSYIGYMYNKTYDKKTKTIPSEQMVYEGLIKTAYYYADSYDYNSTNPNKYTLTNPYKIDSEEDYVSLVGKYTISSDSETDSSTSIKYITAVNGNKMYYISIDSGNNLAYYNNSYTYGDSYTDNGNGTYTINNPTTVTTSDYYLNREILKNKYICKNAINNTCNKVWLVSTTTISTIYYYTLPNVYKYAKGFTYDESSNTYILNNDDITYDVYENVLNNYHYTCYNESGICQTLSYIYSSMTKYQYYINLNNGDDITDVLNDMFYNNDVNSVDSTIKAYIDGWYESNMINYTKFLEDTVFCFDRSQKNADENGWNPNGGKMNTELLFAGDATFKCSNVTDQFSTKNEKAKLKYPVALMNYVEMNLLGIDAVRKTGVPYWLGNPSGLYNKSVYGFFVYERGNLNAPGQYNSYGVRPAISLRPKSTYLSGDGSKDNPYIFDETSTYSINVEMVDETEDLTVEIEDLSQVPEGETVNFKVTPIKGHKVNSIRIVDENNNEVEYTSSNNKEFTFTMPATDVTIIPSFERVKNAVNVEDNKNTKEFVIEVNDSQAVVYEDTVKFRVEPEAGYEVEKIDITDEESNKINYKKTNNINEYEFIMPDTDVLIKPYYRLIPTNNGNLTNPNTKRQVLLIVISIIILGIITTLFIKKKKRLT